MRPSIFIVAAGAAVLFAGGCATTAAPGLKTLRSTSYDTSPDEVWKAAMAAVAEEYPAAIILDPGARRIVSCWRPIDRDPSAGKRDVTGWRFFRVVVEVGQEAPFRVSVSGRAAGYNPPVLKPFEHGGFEEPGWVEGRTSHVAEAIHTRLAAFARPASGEAPAAADPETPENDVDACVIGREILGPGRAFNSGKAGIPLVATP